MGTPIDTMYSTMMESKNCKGNIQQCPWYIRDRESDSRSWFVLVRSPDGCGTGSTMIYLRLGSQEILDGV